MLLTWLGTAALLLEEGGTTLAFDPFPGLPLGGAGKGNASDAAAFRQADAVLATHGHFDHIGDIPALYGAGEQPIYATAAPRKTLERHGIEERRLKPLAPGGSVHINPFTVTAYQGRHCRFDLPLVVDTALRRSTWRALPRMVWLLSCIATYPEKGEILFYEVTDGEKRVQIMGSLGLDGNTVYPTGADCLVLPYQGRSDLVSYALPLVERLQPKRVLLDHWDDAFPPMSDTIETADFCRLLARRGIPCRALTKYETLTL